MQYQDQPPTDPYATQMLPPIELLRVGFSKRLVAYLIDGLIMLTLMMAVAIATMSSSISLGEQIQDQVDAITNIYKMLGIPTSAISTITDLLGGFFLGAIIIGIAYPLIEGVTGASPGKRILRITVAKPDGGRGELPLFMRRYVVKNIASLLQVVAMLPGLGLVDYFGSLFSIALFIGCFFVLGASRLALHDIIAQTAVFHVEDVR
mgnify:CR=1 FL=1